MGYFSKLTSECYLPDLGQNDLHQQHGNEL